MIIIALIFILAGCGRSHITRAEEPIIINSIVFVVDGRQQMVQEGKTYLLGNEQYFDLQISGPVTRVELEFFPGLDREKAVIYPGEKVSQDLYRVQWENLVGEGHFIIYGQAEGKEILIPTGEFTLSAPSC